MTKYQEASQCYRDMVQCWKMFISGRNKDHAHGQIVNDAIRLAQLDLPDPFAALDTGEEETPVEPKVEPKEVSVDKPEKKEDPKPYETKEDKPKFNNWSKNYKK